MLWGQRLGWRPLPCGEGRPGPLGPSTEWSDHIRIPQGTAPYPPYPKYTYAPIFDDISNCKLPAISWVIPDQSYSDHAGNSKLAIGPSWVADIVDAIGKSQSHNCGKDYWGYNTPQGVSSEPTAIFVVWDDWGGWFDHVAPPLFPPPAPQLVRIDQNNPTPAGYTFCDPEAVPPQWGCGYTDGFRVPLLVVSAYTQPHTVSGACGTGESNPCPYFGPTGFPTQYVHDFGSILAYTETNFGMPFIAKPQYADYYAPDWGTNWVPLQEFFGSTPYAFTNIDPLQTGQGQTCFQYHTGTGCPLASGWVATPPDSY